MTSFLPQRSPMSISLISLFPANVQSETVACSQARNLEIPKRIMSHQLTTVVSWTNAEQRLYGARHWFWAVWHVDAVPDYSWDRTEPVESGFCKTKAEARNAAGANRGDVLQRNLWSQQYLEFQRETEKRPFFSRIRSGRKWFWCVGWDLIDDPESTGLS